MRRLAVGLGPAAGLVLALVTGLVAAAGADTAATITFTSPTTDGMTLSSPVTLSGSVSQPQGVVQEIDVTVRWTDTVKRPAAPHPAQQTTIYPPAPQGPTAKWSFTPQPAANGHYTATVVATTQSGSAPPAQWAASRSFVLDVNPATPADFAVTPDTAARTVHLTWAANTEPDLVGYEITRAGPTPADQPKIIAGVLTPGTDFTDTDVATQPAGTYRYTVSAVRQSGDGTKADVSAPTPEQSATFSTPPKSPPSATTTTAAPGAPAKAGSGPAAPGGPATTTPIGPSTHSGGTGIVIAPAGGNNLADYQRLLAQAQATTVTVPPPDPGFDPKLPYKPSTSHQVVQIPGAALESGSLGAADASAGVQRTVEFVAGALVLAVLALFGWVLKRAADQSEALEALPPAPSGAALVDAPTVGPSLMLTMVRPPTVDPRPAERL